MGFQLEPECFCQPLFQAHEQVVDQDGPVLSSLCIYELAKAFQSRFEGRIFRIGKCFITVHDSESLVFGFEFEVFWLNNYSHTGPNSRLIDPPGLNLGMVMELFQEGSRVDQVTHTFNLR